MGIAGGGAFAECRLFLQRMDGGGRMHGRGAAFRFFGGRDDDKRRILVAILGGGY